jgi:dihydrofolate reductase
VFVLTHHPREPLVKGGGTTFTFVTDGIEPALEQARAAAGGRDVAVAGGANVAQQYLSAGLLDEIEIDVAPVLLHAGRRLFEDLAPGLELEQLRSVAAPGVTHVKYRVRRGEAPGT